MNNPTPFIRRLSFLFAMFITAITGFAQTDSVLMIQRIERTEAMLWEDFPKALKVCLDLKEQAAASACILCEGRARILLGKAFWINGQYNKSVELLKQGMLFAQRSGDFNQWAKAANMIGNNFYYQAYYDTAIFYFQEAYSVYKKLDDKSGMAETLGDISLMYHRKGDYQKTVEYLLKGEEVNDELQDSPRAIGDFPGMGNLFSDSLYFREEIADNLRALNVHLKNGNEDAAYKIYQNLGLAYNQVKEYAKAARTYVKMYGIQEKLGIHPMWDYAAMNYRDANMKDSCFFYHEKARQGFNRTTRIKILYTYELLGDAHLHFGQYDSALHNYKIAMKMNSDCNNRITVAGIHRRLADVYTKLKRYDEAETHINNGIALAREVSLAHQRNLYKSAVSLFSQKGDLKKALYFQDQYTNLVDSMSRIETAMNLTRLLAQYKTSKKERELAGLKIEKEKSELELENRNITMISLAGVTLASLVFIVVFALQRNRIKKKNLALDHANKEQEALIREIHHRVKNNLQIITSLVNLKAVKASPETSEVLYQLNGRIYSMGLIHERLYQKNEFQLIALDTYLVELGGYILASFEDADKNVDLKSSCEALQIDVDTALTCGLIMNELMTNSLKYAFSSDQQQREVKVELTKNAGWFALVIADNGKNTRERPENITRNFGLRFVDQLVKSKLNGDWSIELKNGFSVFIKFPVAHE